MYLTDVLTIPSNMAGLPSLSMPCGLSDGLPVGLQLIGPQFSENAIYQRRARARAGDRLRPRPGAAAVSATTWEPVIGLEIHVQLKTQTKMFCRCPNGFGGEPNTQTCPVCLAFPGALPVPNRRAIEETIKLGLALDCTIAERAVFHRKNYFYPDLPKAYQISQYDEPLCADGHLDVPTPDGEVAVGIVRAHLEEDAAKNVHVAASGRIHGATATLVDFNRGGTPLLEIVTAPDIHSADVAKRFLQLLRQTVVELGLSDAELEKGSMRFDVNVSVRPAGSDELRTRTELKNMNSFNFAAKGIEREIARQIGIYESGRRGAAGDAPLRPERRGLAAAALQGGGRGLPLLPGARPRAGASARRSSSSALRAEVGELPAARIRRIAETLSFYDADVLVTGGLDRLWSAVVDAGADAKETANVLANAFVATGVDPAARERGRAGEARLGARRDPARRVRRGARARRATTASAPSRTSRRRPSATWASSTRSSTRVLAANPGEVEQYRGGKQGLLGFFVGQVMKETGGAADPRVVSERLREKLAG